VGGVQKHPFWLVRTDQALIVAVGPTDFRASYDPVSGADGDARQAHPFVGAAAGGRTDLGPGSSAGARAVRA